MTDNKTIPFYGTFTLIYAVLNIVALLIGILTTQRNVLLDDEGDVLVFCVIHMVFGIAAALMCGIGPALVLRKGGKSLWMYAFPAALLLVGMLSATSYRLITISGREVFGFIAYVCMWPATPISNCFVEYKWQEMCGWDILMVFASPLLYALVIYVSYIISRKRALHAEPS